MSIKITKDGRTLRSGKDYTKFRRALYFQQKMNCFECGTATSISADLVSEYSFHVDHTNGRAAGKRDDTPEACKGLCGKCHRIKHHQQSAEQSEPRWSRK